MQGATDSPPKIYILGAYIEPDRGCCANDFYKKQSKDTKMTQYDHTNQGGAEGFTSYMPQLCDSDTAMNWS